MAADDRAIRKQTQSDRLSQNEDSSSPQLQFRDGNETDFLVAVDAYRKETSCRLCDVLPS
jgi:hypothetical protein